MHALCADFTVEVPKRLIDVLFLFPHVWDISKQSMPTLEWFFLLNFKFLQSDILDSEVFHIISGA